MTQVFVSLPINMCSARDSEYSVTVARRRAAGTLCPSAFVSCDMVRYKGGGTKPEGHNFADPTESRINEESENRLVEQRSSFSLFISLSLPLPSPSPHSLSPPHLSIRCPSAPATLPTAPPRARIRTPPPPGRAHGRTVPQARQGGASDGTAQPSSALARLNLRVIAGQHAQSGRR